MPVANRSSGMAVSPPPATEREAGVLLRRHTIDLSFFGFGVRFPNTRRGSSPFFCKKKKKVQCLSRLAQRIPPKKLAALKASALNKCDLFDSA